jgi:hypothetical protein
MRLPRDITGKQLTNIPEHNPLKVGTLNGILNDVSNHLGLSKDELIKTIFKL